MSSLSPSGQPDRCAYGAPALFAVYRAFEHEYVESEVLYYLVQTKQTYHAKTSAWIDPLTGFGLAYFTASADSIQWSRIA